MSNSCVPRRKVAILGAGVIGLTAASHILNRFPDSLDLTLISDKFSPDTTSDKSAAIFSPLCHKDDASYQYEQGETYQAWIRKSFGVFQSIYESPESVAKTGISVAGGFALWDSVQPLPWWKDLLYDFRELDPNSSEMNGVNVSPKCVQVWHFRTFLLNPTLLLDWLLEEVKLGGCKIEQRRISELSELTSTHDVVINCTGLGSTRAVAVDSDLYPVRGQMVLVRAPWIKQWTTQYSPNSYIGIYPRGSEIALGGTKESGSWNVEVDPDTSQKILAQCRELIPSLTGAEVVGSWTGLRPCRKEVRLEACETTGGKTVIHCYGHGGFGITLSWGCASDIGDLLEKNLKLK